MVWAIMSDRSSPPQYISEYDYETNISNAILLGILLERQNPYTTILEGMYIMEDEKILSKINELRLENKEDFRIVNAAITGIKEDISSLKTTIENKKNTTTNIIAIAGAVLTILAVILTRVL